MKKNLYWVVGILASAAGLALIIWGVYIIEPPLCSTVGVYDGEDYGLKGIQKGAKCLGLENVSDLDSIGFNDKISSVRIYTISKVTLYDGANFTGESITFMGNAPDLSLVEPDFNNRASSITVEKFSSLGDDSLVTKPSTEINANPNAKVDLSVNGKHEANIIPGQIIALQWSVKNSLLKDCIPTPDNGWWIHDDSNSSTSASGVAYVSPAFTDTFKLTCGLTSTSQVTINLPEALGPQPTSTEIQPSNAQSSVINVWTISGAILVLLGLVFGTIYLFKRRNVNNQPINTEDKNII